ncbi:MAG: 7-carboxy-7-deazaguanine synthase QueE [Candidatus Aminicenantes bacterium]|nr:7-carboxy-7-deazaguanine synthase QueE [Candidatus Aminicenantes bacterium]
MPRPLTLKIKEIFASVQGEGLRMGRPTLFIRLSGCNLRCSFCDTQSAWEEGEEFSIEDILSAVDRVRKKLPAEWICLTGGEPLTQNVRPLCETLKKKGYSIQVETNGTQPPVSSIDWLTLSPKPPDYVIHHACLNQVREVKLVVTRELTEEIIFDVLKRIPSEAPLFLQPQSMEEWSLRNAERLLRACLKAGPADIRLGLQLHILYNIR